MSATAVQQHESLNRAKYGQSAANYAAIFAGFEAKGIPASDILPRENVFTFNAWKAQGRSVRKGEHGVKCFTWIPTTKTKADGTKSDGKLCRTVTVFHVSQTDASNPSRLLGDAAGAAGVRKMGIQGKTVNAKWMGDQYVVTETGTDNEWYSVDGDNWCEQNGKPVTDATFAAARIVLCGGPRNGETIA